MKNKILGFLFLLSASAYAQTINFTNAALKEQLLLAGDFNIAQDLAGNWMTIDTNENNEIEVSEAQQVSVLLIGGSGITNLQGLENFSELRTFSLVGSGLASINLTGMPHLINLEITESPSLASVNTSSLATLLNLTCRESPLMASLVLPPGNILQSLYLNDCALTSINLANRTNLINLSVDNNPMASINVSGCTSLASISCMGTLVTSLNLSGLTSLTAFRAEGNWNLETLNLSGCTALQELPDSYFFNNAENIVSMDFSGCTGLTSFYITGASLETIDLSGCNAITSVDVHGANLSSLDLSGCTAVATIDCSSGNFTALDFSVCPDLKILDASDNPLVSIDLSGCDLLEDIDLTSCQLPGFTLTGRPNLIRLKLYPNPLLTTLNLSDCTALFDLTQSEAIQNLDLSGCSSINDLYIISPVLQTLDIQGCTSMDDFVLNYNEVANQPITAIDFTGLTNLGHVDIVNSSLTSLDFTGCPNLFQLDCVNTPVTSMNLSDSTSFGRLTLEHVPVESLDLSNMPNLIEVRLTDCAQLETLFVKNGANESLFFHAGDTGLVYVCQDEATIAGTIGSLGAVGITAECNSYCSFTPGGDFNTITGNILFDANNDGCNASDAAQPNIRVDVTDGTADSATFTGEDGSYAFYAGAGTYTLEPQIENPALFTFLPASATTPFANDDNNAATQDFCLSAVGIGNDIEIVIAPIAPARPGFPAVYQLVLKNKGNQTASGSYNFTFDDAIMDFAGATIAPNSQSTGVLNWNYTNLLPFENRSLYITLDVNSPTDVPAVNNDDIVHFTAAINPVAGDINPSDNAFAYDQVVVGAFDPNDITCIEGNVVSPDLIGKYLHYVVNFENTGTYAAENVVVKVVVDTDKYDINSLVLMNTSHNARALLTGNKVEFIFEAIGLAPVAGDPPVGGHGNILFKIKTLPSLVIGDEVEKLANIYFDYNFPVTTNSAETVFQSLANPEFERDESIVLYPNPATSQVNIRCDNAIRQIELFDIQGRILQTVIENSNESQLDISKQSNGIYFIRISTENGQKVEQLSKQ